jgi:hypothetical protein
VAMKVNHSLSRPRTKGHKARDTGSFGDLPLFHSLAAEQKGEPKVYDGCETVHQCSAF